MLNLIELMKFWQCLDVPQEDDSMRQLAQTYMRYMRGEVTGKHMYEALKKFQKKQVDTAICFKDVPVGKQFKFPNDQTTYTKLNETEGLLQTYPNQRVMLIEES